MPTPTKGRRLGGSPAHQRHMMANLATALFEHSRKLLIAREGGRCFVSGMTAEQLGRAGPGDSQAAQ